MHLFLKFIFGTKFSVILNSSSVHHQEFYAVHTAMVYVIQVCWQLASRIRTELVWFCCSTTKPVPFCRLWLECVHNVKGFKNDIQIVNSKTVYAFVICLYRANNCQYISVTCVLTRSGDVHKKELYSSDMNRRLETLGKKRFSRWLANQHRAQWWGLGDTRRQAWEFISGPSLGTRAKFMTFNRIQSRFVTGLLTGHNTPRRHLYLLGLLDSPLCRKCGVGEESSAHILCEALASLIHAYLGSFFLEPEDIRSLGLQGSHDSIWGTKWPS